MRHRILAIFTLLLLSGCNTTGFNPLKIEGQDWHLAAGIERLLTSLTGR